MGIQNLQQRLGEQRKVIVEPLVNARTEEGKGLHQTLDVRVITHIPGQLQTSRNLGITPREVSRTRA